MQFLLTEEDGRCSLSVTSALFLTSSMHVSSGTRHFLELHLVVESGQEISWAALPRLR